MDAATTPKHDAYIKDAGCAAAAPAAGAVAAAPSAGRAVAALQQAERCLHLLLLNQPPAQQERQGYWVFRRVKADAY